MTPPPQPPQEATDIFSISDQVLADRLEFIKEIGFGNWGSVWLCRPKDDNSSNVPHEIHESKIAVKLVHRSKTSTTAARVRSLWNEMKVVRSFKHEPHPSIIPFYSFIITPSYALITMAYQPQLVPVEVSERHAKEWFRSLLSGVEFLHKRGVVHNDIKPANILLSNENIPVLVDFGFAERYDTYTSTAFHSNLSYGTPEYLSPERARGLPHDTRKSDVWSLGVTFFEILVGRTPFEHSEGEQFSTKEDLEKYWARTLRGKWVGSWKMSKSIEKMLRRMVLPNADLRCTASEAMADNYWTEKDSPVATHAHKRSASVAHTPSPSLVLNDEVSKIMDVIPPWPSRSSNNKDKAPVAAKSKIPVAIDKENVASPPGLSKRADEKEKSKPDSFLGRHARSLSQPKLQAESRGVSQTRKHGMPSLLATLSPIKHSPPASSTNIPTASTSFMSKENALPQISSGATNTKPTRKPLGPRQPTPPGSPVIEHRRLTTMASKENTHSRLLPANADKEKDKRRRSRVFTDLTSLTRNVDIDIPKSTDHERQQKENASSKENAISAKSVVKEYKQDSVRDRMKEWERERERIREMERLEERMKEVEEEREREKEKEEEREREKARRVDEMMREMEVEREREREAERQRQLALEEAKEEDSEREQEMAERARTFREEKLSQIPRIAIRSESLTPPESALPSPTPLSPLIEESFESRWLDSYPRSGNESGLSLLKQSLKMSIDKTVRLYKSSTMALGRSTTALDVSCEVDEDEVSRRSVSERASWEDDAIVREAKSSLPVVRHAVRNEQVAAENQLDRMTIWIRNVEKVVEDARQNFAASSSGTPLPPLPVAPIARPTSQSRSQRRVHRKILAANQIFVNEYSNGDISTATSPVESSFMMSPPASASYGQTFFKELPTIPSEEPSRISLPTSPSQVPQTPSRARRATVVTRSPENPKKPDLEIKVNFDSPSPSKRREKSRSQNDLGRPITPITKLEFEIERLANPQPIPTPRLSAVVDKNLFIADKFANKENQDDDSIIIPSRRTFDELTASPLHVEPYPPRPQSVLAMDTPGRKHVEGVYDRFLMSTTGVKRNGRGYQSDNVGPISNIAPAKTTSAKRSQNFFNSTRRPMPPPVSSEDWRKSASVDEFGMMSCSPGVTGSAQKAEGNNTFGIVRRALRTIVNGNR